MPTSCDLQLIEIDIFIVCFQFFQIFMNIHMCLYMYYVCSIYYQDVFIHLFFLFIKYENEKIESFVTV